MAIPRDLATVGEPICVKATTQDGRYSAEDNFALQQSLAKDNRAGLDRPTKYVEITRTFPLREVAVVARRGSCADQAELIPVIFGEGNFLATLQVLVNTRGAAVTAALRDPVTGRTIRRANCVRVAGAARVAFDARCVLGPASELPPHVRLRLEQVSHDGLQTEILESVMLRLGD